MSINLPIAEYYTLIVTVPETDADNMRNTMAQAGAGIFGNYTHCTFSVKGTGRFMPQAGSHPHIGNQGVIESVMEERIETVCARECLELVIDAIKKAHPYEKTVIDIYPIYRIACK